MSESQASEKNPSSNRNLVLRALPMEFLGTFAVAYIGGMSQSMDSNMRNSLPGVALAHGITYAVFIYIGYDLSGAHFNPAVSVAYFILQKETFMQMLMYMGAQLMGGMMGGAQICMNISVNYLEKMLPKDILGYPTVRNEEQSYVQMYIPEVILTIILVILICLVTESTPYKKDIKGPYALCIGAYYGIATLAVGRVTGGALNPARVFGPLLLSGTIKGSTSHYLLGTLAGGLFGAFCYKNFLKYTRDDEIKIALQNEQAGNIDDPKEKLE